VIVHFRDATGTWQTRQVQGQDVIPIDCLVDYRLTLAAIYQDMLCD
jgi:hypothetical protein